MPGEFEPVRVSMVDGRLQLIGGEIVVGLKGSRALGRPIIHGARSIVRIRKRVHLNREAALAFEIGAGHVELGSRQGPRVDESLQFEVRVRLQAARGSRRRYAAREVQTRSAV